MHNFQCLDYRAGDHLHLLEEITAGDIPDLLEGATGTDISPQNEAEAAQTIADTHTRMVEAGVITDFTLCDLLCR